MSTFFGTYGDDAEFDNYVEKRIDPEWTGRETDPYGWRADREQARWERDRGCAVLLPVLGLAFVVLGVWGYVADWFVGWQFTGLLMLALFSLGCVACCHNDGTRDRLDALAPKGEVR